LHTGVCRHRRLSSSVGVCNTPRRACRRLHARRPGDDVMTPALHGGPVVLRPVRATPCFSNECSSVYVLACRGVLPVTTVHPLTSYDVVEDCHGHCDLPPHPLSAVVIATTRRSQHSQECKDPRRHRFCDS